MGILDRISAIETRMHEIQTLISSQQVGMPSTAGLAGQGSFQAVMGGVMGTQMAQQASPSVPGMIPGMTPGVPGMMPGMPGMMPGMPGMMPGTAGLTAPGMAAPGLMGVFPGMVAPSQPANDTTGTGAPGEFDDFVKEACDRWGVDQVLIKAVIQQESAFNPKATSSCGAQGLMQLMPETARSLGVTDAYDPRQNIMGGTRYLKGLLERFNGDTRLALAAYNAGAGNVQKYGGVPPFAETQNYVTKIMANYERMKTSKG